MSAFKQRIVRAQQLLADQGMAAVIATSPRNLFYFSGIWLDSNERLQAVVIPQKGVPVIIAHEMFREEVRPVQGMEQQFWADGEDAIALLGQALPRGAEPISVDSHWPSGHFIQLIKIQPQLSYVESTSIIETLRSVKDAAEIALLQESGQAVDRVMEKLMRWIKTGITELEVVREVKRLFREEGIYDLSFEPIVAAGGNAALPHHQPDQTVLKTGDTVVLDIGGVKNHYCSDMTRTVVLGEASAEISEVYRVVQRAQEATVKAIQPGRPMQEIDQVARGIICQAGYGPCFTHRTGHGIGLEVHEEPYLAPGNRKVLEAGMVVSVEPGIYLPGKFGIRVEDIVVVTANGAIRLNQVTRQLVCVKE